MSDLDSQLSEMNVRLRVMFAAWSEAETLKVSPEKAEELKSGDEFYPLGRYIPLTFASLEGEIGYDAELDKRIVTCP